MNQPTDFPSPEPIAASSLPPFSDHSENNEEYLYVSPRITEFYGPLTNGLVFALRQGRRPDGEEVRKGIYANFQLLAAETRRGIRVEYKKLPNAQETETWLVADVCADVCQS